jgi:hypothetical protein
MDKQTRQAALERQAQRLDRRIHALEHISRRYTWARLAVFLAAIFICALIFDTFDNTAGWLSVLVALLIFGALVFFNRRVNRTIHRYQLWRDIKQTHIARMMLDWKHIPASTREPRVDHPFDADIDISGDYSIHRLLDTAMSLEGSQRLYEWLAETAPVIETIQERQALVREMARLPRFCDRLTLDTAMTTGSIHQRWSSRRLLDWLTDQPDSSWLRAALVALAVLSPINIVLLILAQLGALPPLWRITFTAYALITASQYFHISALFGNALTLNGLLNNLKSIFDYLERYPYPNVPRLKTLCTPFLDTHNRPSSVLRNITGLLAAASLQQNPILRLAVNVVIPWDIFFAYQLDQQKRTLQKLMPGWLETWHELEALASLATFSHLNPAYAFPEIDEPVGTRRALSLPSQPVFSARQIGHPLLHDEVRVCNDFTITALGEVAIITGSNMSGKSSFLRTLGVSLALAYAGGPVCAQSLQTSVFRLFTCIRVSDSVTDGISYFYAEVKRLKRLLDALQDEQPLPLFFLIDEIFRGTNNRERLIGSRAYIRALTGKHGAGLISTHDLELVRMADESSQITNYHFEDTISDGRMSFDYRLRSGPSPTTNALKIMAIEGLPVTSTDV